MDDEVAHVGIVDRALCSGLPCLVGLGIVGIDPDDVEGVEILELDAFQILQFAAENEMEQLLLGGVGCRYACLILQKIKTVRTGNAGAVPDRVMVLPL
ncbi:MAG: hypothetical protein Kow0032_02570 [Methyloligellaceae bacterium]